MTPGIHFYFNYAMVEYISCPFRTFATNSSVLSIKKAISWKLYELISLYTSIWAFSDLDIKYGGHKTSPSMTVITLYLKLINILLLRNFTIPNLTNLWPLSVFMTFILFDFRFQNKYLVFRRDWDGTVLLFVWNSNAGFGKKYLFNILLCSDYHLCDLVTILFVCYRICKRK